MLKTGLRFILNSSILLGFFAFTFTFGLHHNWQEKVTFSAAVFFSVIGIYNFHRLYKFKNNQLTESLKIWVKLNLLTIQLLCFFGILLSSCLFLFLLNFELQHLVLLSVCLLISLIYVILKWREFPFLKAFLVALVWTIVLVILPNLMQAKLEIGNLTFMLFFYALTIPSDARDIKIDHKKMKTLPQLIGKKRSYRIAILLLNLFVLLQSFSIDIKFTLVLFNTFWFSYIQYFERRHKIRIELADILLFIYGIVFLLRNSCF
jgi:hypothetical protein